MKNKNTSMVSYIPTHRHIIGFQ